jgi:acyl-CoA ligase (AMP-forming) (exosortase A-associated)
MEYLIHHLLQASALRVPTKEALVDKTERLTFQEITTSVERVANGLREVGLRRGDRVGIYLEMSLPQAISIFAVSQAGGVFVPINSLLFPEQVEHIARDCQMKGLITSQEKLASLGGVLQSIGSLRFSVVTENGEDEGGRLPVYTFNDLYESAPRQIARDWGIGKDLAAILYTSGSTGKPKGVMLSHAQVIAGSSIVLTYLQITEADRILAILPFSFDAGLNQLITAFQSGGTAVLKRFVFAREIVQILLEEKVTGMGGVPTLWSLLAQPNSTAHNYTFPHLRYITNTGGAMPQVVLTKLRNMFPTTRIYLMYGLTEAFRSTYLPPEELVRRPTSMGKAIPNTEILLVNEQGEPCQPGEVGELVHRGPTVSMGYWNQPELTAKVLRPHPFLARELNSDEKVCYSGDLVKMDEEGFLYFVGRRDNLIKSSGFRVSPTEVEEVLFQSGKVCQAAVIGIPDDSLGQCIKAFVVPQVGESLNENTLIAFCAERLPRYMVPKVVQILDNLPKTPSGKVDYPALRRLETMV